MTDDYLKLERELAERLRGAEAFTEDTMTFELAEVREFRRALRLAAVVEEAEVALSIFSLSGPDADGFEWAHFDSGRCLGMVNLTAMPASVRVAFKEAVEAQRDALARIKEAREG
jgi:hypothetical protein